MRGWLRWTSGRLSGVLLLVLVAGGCGDDHSRSGGGGAEGEGEGAEAEGQEGEGQQVEGEGEGGLGEGEGGLGEGEGGLGEGEGGLGEGEGGLGEGEGGLGEGEGEGDPVNTPPRWQAPEPLELEAGQSRVMELRDWVTDAQDGPAGLTFGVAGAVRLTVSLEAATGRLTVRAPADLEGEETLMLSATDQGGLTASTPLLVRVVAGQPRPGCGDVTFTFAAPGLDLARLGVAGGFNGWGGPQGPGWPTTLWDLTDPDGDGTWTLIRAVEPGDWPYKFVLFFQDGRIEWRPDPNNPDRADDGFGGYNSVLHANPAVCRTTLALVNHATAGDRFTATLRLAQAEGGVDPATVRVTLDWAPVDAARWTVNGDELLLDLTGLPRGIHDVRVAAGDQAGALAEELLLKVYVGVSTDWRDVTLYFVMTDRFVNGDPGNDGPRRDDVPWPVAYQGGDHVGLRTKLEQGYFDQLGTSAIWISWPVDNPGEPEPGYRPSEDARGCGLSPQHAPARQINFSAYHGYWPAQLEQAEEHFGTLADLQALVTAAHARGIRILLDFTANHVHEDSPLYQQHRNDGYFHQPAQICADVGWDNQPVTCWFTGFLPDMNYSNPAARRAILDSAIRWIARTGADGFRFDAVKHLEPDFVRELRARLRQEVELTGIPFYVVGETFDGRREKLREFIGDDLVHGQFDFPLNLNLLKAFATREIGLNDLHDDLLRNDGAYGPTALMSRFLGNHDIARFVSLANGDTGCGAWDVYSEIAVGWNNPPPFDAPADPAVYARLRLAFAYLFGIPGIPLIYYGDEFGMRGAGDPDNRRMMRFDDRLGELERETLAFMQRLGPLRASHPALRTGTLVGPVRSERDVLVFGRRHAEENVVVALNRGDGDTQVDVDAAVLGFVGGEALRDGLGAARDVNVAGGRLRFTLPGRSAAILVP